MVELVEGSATMRVTHIEEARMRGDDRQQAGMWSYISPEQRVPHDHPLRPIPAMVDAILAELSPEFAPLYSPVGRPSIPPEKLLRALLLQVQRAQQLDRKSTRLNSSHLVISYAVFCLKKKKITPTEYVSPN